MFDNDEWLSQIEEKVIDPDRPIIDPHHHLWKVPELPYDLNQLLKDTGDGHNVVKTIFMECSSSYHADGPEHLRPVGETDYVAARAVESRLIAEKKGGAYIAGIVAHADLRHEALDHILDAHTKAGKGLFSGVRHAAAWDANPSQFLIPPPAQENLLADKDLQRGVNRLGERGLTFDTWLYHHQIPAFAELARQCPNTTLVLDHFGTPLGVGVYAGKQDQIFDVWKRDIAEVASLPNTVAKLGGLAMPDNGFPWFGSDRPASSDELVEAQEHYYHHTIECFGPERCMFESNFPVDRLSIGYRTLWNAFKKIASKYDAKAQQLMFYDTAARIYGIE